MIGFFWNVLLATAWVFLTGSFEVLNYLFGFAIGYIITALIHNLLPSLQGYPQRLPRFFAFIVYFLRQLIESNIKVASDIVTPPWHMKPGVLRYQTTPLSDLEITLFANLISLTPGTLVLDVSEDKTCLFVHAMFLHDEEQAQQELHELEQRFLRVIR